MGLKTAGSHARSGREIGGLRDREAFAARMTHSHCLLRPPILRLVMALAASAKVEPTASSMMGGKDKGHWDDCDEDADN